VSHPAGFYRWGYFLWASKKNIKPFNQELNMKNKPEKDKLLRLSELLYDRIGPIDELVEMVGDSMMPTFKPGSLVALKALPNPELLYWSEYYYIIDDNDQSLVRRVYASEIQNCIKLVSDHPDQGTYPPIFISWNQVKAIYKVKAEIVKH
jgi:hypothetical protein